MVRKWSYITNYSSNSIKQLQNYTTHPKQYNIVSATNFSINNLKLVNRFRFKVFRKNTRFKSYSLGYTNFVRKTVSLGKRRTGWKNYVVISSSWVKPNLKYRQLVSFIQSKLLFQNAVPFPTVNTFTKNIVPVKNLGSGLYGVNHSFLSKSLFSKFFVKPFKTKPSKTRSFIQSYNIKSLSKMHNSGLLIPSVSYDNSYYLIDSCSTNKLSLVVGKNLSQTILYIVSKITLLLRLVHVYTILNLNIKK
jgi:hypothetical protein